MFSARVSDWNGTYITKDGFLSYLQAEYPELYEAYWIRGKTDLEAKRQAKPEVFKIFETASENALYPVELMPHVRERLHRDHQEGYARVIFSSISSEALSRQATKLGIREELDHIVSLNELMQRFSLSTAIKEDPEVYRYLAVLLHQKGFDHLDTYTDDGLPRVQAAVAANQRLIEEGQKGFEMVYHFNPDALLSPALEAGYTTINDLLHLKQ